MISASEAIASFPVKSTTPWFRKGVVGVLLLASAAVPVLASSASAEVIARPASGQGGWSISNSPDRGTFDELDGVAVTSSGQTWAVGRYIDSAGVSRALIENSTWGSWKVALTIGSSSRNSYLTGISADSPSDIWAVGYTDTLNYQDSRTFIKHWDGRAWSAYSPTVSGALFGVSSLNADDAWAVGTNATNGGNPATLIEHWNGTDWHVVASSGTGADGNSVSAVLAISSSNAWAVGQSDPTVELFKSLVLHWNGSTWSPVKVPELGLDSELRSLSGSSSDDVWVTGDYDVSSPQGTGTYALTEHWDGRTWKVFSVPGATGDDLLAGSDTLSASDAWAVGSQAGKDDLITHWNGTAWQRIAGPGEPHSLNLLFAVSGSNQTGLTATGLFIDLRVYSYDTLVEKRR